MSYTTQEAHADIVTAMEKVETKKNLKGESMFLSKETRKKLSHKEKYGKCGTKGMRSNFKPFDNGFITTSKVPDGYNWALGYTTDTNQ